MKINDFINLMLPYALDECIKRGYNVAVAFTCLSQCALETGWLKSDLMRVNCAPFGIKYHLQDGKYYQAKTKEYIKGQYVDKTDIFQAYDNMRCAFADYYTLLESGRYKECLKAQNVKDCITIIKNGGYATDPEYINSVVAVYNTICASIRG